MTKINDGSEQATLRSSEARELETKIEELQRRLALVESAIQEAASWEGTSEKSTERLLHRRSAHVGSVIQEASSWENTPEERTERLLNRLDEWLADESGYDEEVWPKLKAGLEEDRLSSRNLFDE